MTPQERIKADAEAYANNKYGEYASNINDFEYPAWEDCVTIYIAGATAENSRAQVAIDILEEAYNSHVEEKRLLVERYPHLFPNIDNYVKPWVGKAKAFLEQWEGKESDPPAKQIEYMPIHPEDAKKSDCPTQFPMHLLDEGQAFSNHGQSLKRLKERGGLSVREILAIVGKKPWAYYCNLSWEEAIKMLNEIVIANPQK